MQQQQQKQSLDIHMKQRKTPIIKFTTVLCTATQLIISVPGHRSAIWLSLHRKHTGWYSSLITKTSRCCLCHLFTVNLSLKTTVQLETVLTNRSKMVQDGVCVCVWGGSRQMSFRWCSILKHDSGYSVSQLPQLLNPAAVWTSPIHAPGSPQHTHCPLKE